MPRLVGGLLCLISHPPYLTVGALIDDLIEHLDDIQGVRFPLHWTGGKTVWAHTTEDVRRWLQEFANDRALWSDTIPTSNNTPSSPAPRKHNVFDCNHGCSRHGGRSNPAIWDDDEPAPSTTASPGGVS